jgi:hypothetical protein
MLIGYPEGLYITARPLILESQLRVLATRILRTRSAASSSAIVPQILMGKTLNIPGNARPIKR